MEDIKKFIGKVGSMYITAIFHTEKKKVSLSENINDACHLEHLDWIFAEEKLGAKIISVTTTYKEV